MYRPSYRHPFNLKKNKTMEDEEDFDDGCYECEFCSAKIPYQNHDMNCPNSMSPFSELIINGYD